MLSNVDILSRVIIEDASRQIQAILEKAKKESEAIIEEGLQKIKTLKKEDKMDKSRIEASFTEAKRIAQAEFLSHTEILGRKEKILREIIQQLQKDFFELPQQKDYPLILKGLILDAIRHLEKEGKSFVCCVNSKDYGILSPYLADLVKRTDKELSLDETPIYITGGVILFRADQRVSFDNSLEAIFERKRGQMRCIAAEYIFGQC